MSEKIKKEKIKRVFTDNLPHSGMKINWIKSVGCKVRFIYDNIEGWIEIVDKKEKYLYIKYLDKDTFKISCGDFTKCKLGRLLNKYTSDFKYKIGQVIKDDKRDLIIIDRKILENNKGWNIKYYKYKCNKCGFECDEHYSNQEFNKELWILEGSLIGEHGCSCCSSGSKIVSIHINSIVETNDWMIPYFQGGYDEAKMYSCTSNKRIHPICPDCGRVKNKTTSISNIYGLHSIGCQCNSDGVSYCEKLMFNMLEQLNIDFIPEYSPNWIKPRRYDFYIPKLSLIIETDGGLGHGERDNDMNGQTKEESKEIDDYKDKMAKEHGLDVVRIDCNYSKGGKNTLKYIKQNILNSKLSEIFDLSNINWLKCEEFALSNLVKIACDYKLNNPNLSTVDIGKIMKKSPSTILRYLRQGSKLNWCDYNVEIEKRKGLSIGRELNKTKVEVFMNKISLGVFDSLTCLENISKEKFGIKLDRHYVSDTIKGIREEYHGFTFKTTNSQQTA